MRTLRQYLVTLATCFVMVTAVALTDGSRKVAFLVGINDYKKPNFEDLKYAERDVTAVAYELSNLGFEVVMLTGPRATRHTIHQTVRRLVRPLGKEDLVLVMLSGHGRELPVTGPDGTRSVDQFYCPVDAIADDPTSLVSLSELTDRVLTPNVGRSLVIVDVGRDRPIRSDKGSRGIQGDQVRLTEGTSYFFSCRSGQQSFETDEIRHGVFTYCLVEALQGAGARGNAISWTGIVGQVYDRMSQPDIKGLLRGESQEPLAAGFLPRTILGHVDPRRRALANSAERERQLKQFEAEQDAIQKAISKNIQSSFKLKFE